jgi:hypothetical protein
MTMTKLTHKLALLAGLGLAIGAVSYAPPAPAASYVSVTVGTRPPPPRYERIPSARPGYAWAPGYWNWAGARYVWVGGHWYAPRHGYVYASPRWVPAGRGWRFERETWRRNPHGGYHGGYRHHR